VKPSSHSKLHLPLVQAGWPLVVPQQALLHVPQCRGSSAVFTQAALQFTVPAPQVSVHWPAEQTFLAAQALPQAPQCCGSLSTSTHVPEQSTNGARQVVRHWPASQLVTPPGGETHGLPQAPQFATSVC
jgi:hypothetical protein